MIIDLVSSNNEESIPIEQFKNLLEGLDAFLNTLICFEHPELPKQFTTILSIYRSINERSLDYLDEILVVNYCLQVRHLIEKNSEIFEKICKILQDEFQFLKLGASFVPTIDDILMLPYSMDVFFFNKIEPESVRYHSIFIHYASIFFKSLEIVYSKMPIEDALGTLKQTACAIIQVITSLKDENENFKIEEIFEIRKEEFINIVLLPYMDLLIQIMNTIYIEPKVIGDLSRIGLNLFLVGVRGHIFNNFQKSIRYLSLFIFYPQKLEVAPIKELFDTLISHCNDDSVPQKEEYFKFLLFLAKKFENSEELDLKYYLFKKPSLNTYQPLKAIFTFYYSFDVKENENAEALKTT